MNKNFLKEIGLIVIDAIKFRPYYQYQDEKNIGEKQFNFRIILNILYITILSFISIAGWSYLKSDFTGIVSQLDSFGILVKLTVSCFWIFIWILSLFNSLRLETGSYMFSLAITIGIMLAEYKMLQVGIISLIIGILLWLFIDIIPKIIEKVDKIKLSRLKNEIPESKNNISK